MPIQITFDEQNQLSSDTLVVGLPDHLNQLGSVSIQGEDLTDALDTYKQRHLISSEVGKVSATFFESGEIRVRLITVGLGNLKNLDRIQAAKVYGNLLQYFKQAHVNNADILFSTFDSKAIEKTEMAELFGLQGKKSLYVFDNYKSDKKVPYHLSLRLHEAGADEITAIKDGEVIGEGIKIARDLSNIPPNILTPEYFADLVTAHFEETAVEVDVKDAQTLQAEGFGLIHAVGKGSDNGPRLITLTYNGATDADAAPIALVGKGITYDSGGYSIKSKPGMQEMKFDMCGAANVVGMIEAAHRLALPVNIVGIIASAENMINGKAMKPDDVFTAMSGETVEVLNTDAEGRLVLGDAVFQAAQHRPKVILDFATLTGAAIAALGFDKAAVFKNNAQAPLNEITAITQQNGEWTYELPVTATEQSLIKNSEVADLVNHTNGMGKALFAAAFIMHFSNSIPHLHFDIAGPATTSKASYNGPKGPTGFLIQSIIDWLRK
ncbi:leucyl aminopeptidase family protein [Staphylococcus simulans]|uniref:leucyl aminopeptidase family protein n=1 Tax=Staphylococcus simulans TaxID=1286 RepID=UPI003F817044